MKIDNNGTVRDMTADEIKEFEEMLKKDDLLNKIDTLFVMNRLTTE